MPLPQMDITIGEAAAGIYASVHDLGSWMIMNLNDGMNGEDTLVSKANHDMMWRPHTNIRFNVIPGGHYNQQFSSYGLGWSVDDFDGYTVIGHGGGLPGMLSKTRMIPELGIGVVVLTNTDPGGYSYEMISRSIIDSYLDIQKVDWISLASKIIDENQVEEDSVMTAVWKTVKQVNKKDLELDDYIGVYHDNWFGDIEITKKDDGLYIHSIRSPKLSGDLLFYEDETFVAKWDYTQMECNAFATFTKDENGIPNGLTMKGVSPNIDFSFDFHHLNFSRVEEQ